MRLIDADALKMAFEEDGHLSGYIEEYIDDAPSVDAVPVVHARWDEPQGFQDGFWVCSACNFCTEAIAAPQLYNYCPNCGSQMDSEGDD
jgi:rubrerythrin